MTKTAESPDAEETTNPETEYIGTVIAAAIAKITKHLNANRKRSGQLHLVGDEDAITCRIKEVEDLATRCRVAELASKAAMRIRQAAHLQAQDKLLDAGLADGPGDKGYVYTAALTKSGRRRMTFKATIKRTFKVDSETDE